MKTKHKCDVCNSPKSSFICKTCHKHICILCVFVTVILGKWSFYCSQSCAPYNVDAYNNEIKEAS